MNFKTHLSTEKILFLTLEENIYALPKQSPIFTTIDEFIEKGIRNCVIDIGKAHFMGSAAIGLMVIVLTKFRNKGGEVILMNPSEQTQKVLLITKLNAIFTIVYSKEEALQFFAVQNQ
ncbi:MAG: anti-sigma factor antagonist [Cytophagales bacterium]|nr:MAG: anti-sigma factor antagonist [Cytophagales bacterium]